MSASPTVVLTEAEITEREQRQIDRANSRGKTPVVSSPPRLRGSKEPDSCCFHQEKAPPS